MKKNKNIFLLLSVLFLLLKTSFSEAKNICYYSVFFQEIGATKKNKSLEKEYLEIQNIYEKEKYSEALKLALKLAEKVKGNNPELEYKSLFLIGNIFNKRNNNLKALSYFIKSLEVLQEKNLITKDKKILFSNNEILANTYLRIGSQYSINGNRDSSKVYYKKIIDLNSLSNKLTYIKGKAYNNLSGTYMQESNYKLAEFYIKKAIDIHKKNNKKLSESKALNNLGNIYLEEKKYEEAKKIYTQSLALIKNYDNIDAIKHKEDLYYNIAWTLYLLKDYTAYEYQEKSYILKDTLTEREMRRIVKGVFEKHKVDLEQQKVNLVKEQRKLAEAQESKTNILFGALSLLVIIISGVVVYNYKLRQKNLQLKLSENSLLQQQSIEKLKSEAHTKILNAAIDGKETERKQIAEILHDNVSALLSSANMHLSATKKQLNNNHPTEIEKTQAIILEASQKVRDLSHNLVSSILLKFGLEYAIKDVAKKYSNSELKFDVSANNIHRYNQEFEIKIFNVIQELINNIIKHSKATNAKIIIKEEKNQLTILVKDDGVGFSTSSSSLNDGIGLNQIEARVKMMSGKLTIDSEVNKGTSIFITVPIQQKQISKLSSVS